MLENIKKRILSIISPINEDKLSINKWEKRSDNKLGQFYSSKVWQSNLDGAIGHRFILIENTSLFGRKWQLFDYSNNKEYSVLTIEELSKLVPKTLKK